MYSTDMNGNKFLFVKENNMQEPTKAQIVKIKEAMEGSEPRSEYQTEIEKLTTTIKNQEHNLAVNRLLLSTLKINDFTICDSEPEDDS